MSKIHLCSRCGEKPKVKSSWCQDCSNEYERGRWATLSKSARIGKWLKHKYGLTFEDFMEMYEEQEGSCAVCDISIYWEDSPNTHQKACVDHCHDTGKVRGLLCNHCNRALGLLKENKETLNRMLEYIE